MKISIIGCGNMGQGMARRLALNNHLFLYDHTAEKIERLQKEGCGVACKNLPEAVRQSDIVILAVKPQSLKEVVDLFPSRPPKILISLLAGTQISQLKECFPTYRIIRMMPNLALIYGEGLIGLTVDKPLNEIENSQLSKICEPLGKVYWFPENKIDAFTSLAGSGPAFFFSMFKSMVDAGIQMGFNAKDSQDLVHQMIKGSLILLDKSAKHSDELIKQITSPGGTTMAGLRKFEEFAVHKGIISTFLAACARANELSKA